MFIYGNTNDGVYRVCYLGDRLLQSPKTWHFDTANWSTSLVSDADWCNKNITGDIWSR